MGRLSTRWGRAEEGGFTKLEGGGDTNVCTSQWSPRRADDFEASLLGSKPPTPLCTRTIEAPAAQIHAYVGRGGRRDPPLACSAAHVTVGMVNPMRTAGFAPPQSAGIAPCPRTRVAPDPGLARCAHAHAHVCAWPLRPCATCRWFVFSQFLERRWARLLRGVTKVFVA